MRSTEKTFAPLWAKDFTAQHDPLTCPSHGKTLLVAEKVDFASLDSVGPLFLGMAAVTLCREDPLDRGLTAVLYWQC
jgi:hypothetical protein